MQALPPSFRLTEGNSVFLDLIRGLSAQAVVVGHGLYFYGFASFTTSPDVFVMQSYAVLIFFILSGFLITYSTVNKLRRRPDYGFGQFFIDRFARIYTGFIPALLFVLLVDSLSRSFYPDAYTYANSFNLKTFTGNLLMLQDVPFANHLFGGRMTSFGSGRPFWSLAIEWWIYLFFGWALLRLLPRRGNSWVNLLVFLPLLIVPSFNLWGGRGNGLMMTWLLGSLAYLIVAGGYLNKLHQRQLWLLSAWLTALGVVRFLKTGEEYDPILAFLSTAVILLLTKAFASYQWPARLAWLIRKNAAFSFTLYLVHYAVMDILRSAYGSSVTPWVLLLIAFLLSNLCAMAIGLYTETTLTARVKQWLYARFLRA
jgi:peptidoglycan/LPS O-acetylase OafA/YrhL